MRNGGTIGFNFDSPEEVDAWHAARRRRGRHVDARIRPAIARAASASSTSLICAIPTATSSAALHRPPQ